jgi:hypothetical protein
VFLKLFSVIKLNPDAMNASKVEQVNQSIEFHHIQMRSSALSYCISAMRDAICS